MIKKLSLLLCLLSFSVVAGLPPTSSKISGDATKKTTFDFEFPIFTGTHTGSRVSITGATTIPVSGDVVLTGAQFNSSQVGYLLAHTSSTGVAGGSILSIDAITSRFDLSQQYLTFAVNTVSSELPVIKSLTCPALDSQVVTNIATADVTYILVDDTCAVTQQTTFPDPNERRLKAFIGRINHPNRTTIQTVFASPDYVVDPISQYYDLVDSMGPFNVSGNAVSPNGANLSIDRSSGIIFRRGSNYDVDDQNPHEKTFSSATVANLFRSTQTSTGTTLFTTLDVANYDVAGTVTAIGGTAGRSTNQRVYLLASGNLSVQYGQVVYTNLANAVAGIPNEAFVINPSVAASGVLIGVISCRRDATDASNSAQCVFSKVSRFDSSGVSVGSNSVATLQSAYDNSVTPQITTSTSLGSFDLRRGSAADTDPIFRGQNGAGTSTFTLLGNGGISGASLTLSTALTIANGGTGATTKAAAFDALSPMTTGGDLIYGGASGTGTRLANGTSGQVLTSSGGTSAPTWTTPAPRNSFLAIENVSFATSVAANALTVALKDSSGADPSSASTLIGFRSSTATSGAYVTRTITSALSIVIPSGATLGHQNGIPKNIWLYAIDNAGTVELAVSSNTFDESFLHSTTAISGSSTSISALYSTTARSNVAIRLIGRMLSSQTTAGTYAAVPTNSSMFHQQGTTVSAYYRGSPPTGTLNAGYNTVTFGTAVRDSANAYSSGIYTVPESGLYSISSQVSISGTFSVDTPSYIAIFIDGVQFTDDIVYAYASTLPTAIVQVSAQGIPLRAGQSVTIRAATGATSPSFQADANRNYFSIVKTGSY